MTTPRPVRYRCDIAAHLSFDTGEPPLRARVIELSENGLFLDEQGLGDLDPGTGATIGLPLPGGDAWVTHVRVTRVGRARIDVKTRAADHLSVSVRGYGAEFDAMSDDDVERLRGFLELLDTR